MDRRHFSSGGIFYADICRHDVQPGVSGQRKRHGSAGKHGGLSVRESRNGDPCSDLCDRLLQYLRGAVQLLRKVFLGCISEDQLPELGFHFCLCLHGDRQCGAGRHPYIFCSRAERHLSYGDSSDLFILYPPLAGKVPRRLPVVGSILRRQQRADSSGSEWICDPRDYPASAENTGICRRFRMAFAYGCGNPGGDFYRLILYVYVM